MMNLLLSLGYTVDQAIELSADDSISELIKELNQL